MTKILSKSDWNLLVLTASDSATSPVQLQKILFLIGKNLPTQTQNGFYDFRPYDYGPFDATVYSDAEQLSIDGLVTIRLSQSGKWREYLPSPKGFQKAEEIKQGLPTDLTKYLQDLVLWVKSLDFEQLVKYIYREYPDYKVNSVFRG
jgi:uncharacterized protein